MKATAAFTVAIAIASIVVVATFVFLHHWGPQPHRPLVRLAHPAGATLTNPFPPIVVTNSMASQVPVTGASLVLANWPGFQKRPFPVAYQSADFQWTLADGKDTNVIRKLAHNRLEYARMVEENPLIFRRELVYLKVTAASVFERAKSTGRPVTELTLPGVDGQELQFQIVKSQSNAGSSRQGMFRGHLVGDDDSLVTLAFQDGREAFTVLAPKENIFVLGEPRENGQVIVNAIDPNTYGRGPEDANDAIKTNPTQK